MDGIELIQILVKGKANTLIQGVLKKCTFRIQHQGKDEYKRNHKRKAWTTRNPITGLGLTPGDPNQGVIGCCSTLNCGTKKLLFMRL